MSKSAFIRSTETNTNTITNVDLNAKRTTRSGLIIASSPPKKIKLLNVGRVCDRLPKISKRGAALLVNAAYKDAGVKAVVDKSKIMRAIDAARSATTNEHLSQLQQFINASECFGIFFDEKKDLSNSIEKNQETGNYHPKKVIENHCALLLQPGVSTI